MAIVNTAGAPPAELRATIVVIHKNKPATCPDCGAALDLACDVADNAPENVAAWRCSGIGHRIHAFLENTK